MSILSSLDWIDGKSNPSGIKSIAYFIRKSDVIAPLPIIDTDGVSYKGDIEPAVGVNFQTIYTTQGSGKVDVELVGNKDGKQPVNKASLAYPDINDNAKAFISNFCNANLVIIVPHHTVSGVRYAVFGLEYDADVKLTGTSGDKPGSDKGLKIEIESPDYVALPNYKGLIPLTTGMLDCATGVFTPAPAEVSPETI